MIERAEQRSSAHRNTLIAIALATVALVATIIGNLEKPAVAWFCVCGATGLAIWITVSTLDMEEAIAAIERWVLATGGMCENGLAELLGSSRLIQVLGEGLELCLEAVYRSKRLLALSAVTGLLLAGLISNIEHQSVAMCCIGSAVLYAIWSGCATFVYAQTCIRVESWIRQNVSFPLVITAGMLMLVNFYLAVTCIWAPLLLVLFPIITIFSPVVIGWMTACLIWTSQSSEETDQPICQLNVQRPQ